jgi:hypothetical protein
MPTSTNRTKWPLKGGAISIQPGWFPGHSLALFYINMGFGNEPLNYSHAMLPMFQITGPANVQYNGTFCLPQVPLPANYTPSVGDNATIQIIETAQHGGALYNVCPFFSAFDSATGSLPIYISLHLYIPIHTFGPTPLLTHFANSAQTSPSPSPKTSPK